MLEYHTATCRILPSVCLVSVPMCGFTKPLRVASRSYFLVTRCWRPYCSSLMYAILLVTRKWGSQTTYRTFHTPQMRKSISSSREIAHPNRSSPCPSTSFCGRRSRGCQRRAVSGHHGLRAQLCETSLQGNLSHALSYSSGALYLRRSSMLRLCSDRYVGCTARERHTCKQRRRAPTFQL